MDNRDTLPLVLIVSGLPATGKTTLARRLARDLRLPLVTKDDIKETLFEALGWRDREWSKMLGRATYGLIYHFVETHLAVGCSVAAESNFEPIAATRELSRLKALYTYYPVQVQCYADGAVLVERFRQRNEAGERHPGHVDETVYDEIDSVLRRGTLGTLDIGGSVIEVDTTAFAAVKYEAILQQVQEAALMTQSSGQVPS